MSEEITYSFTVYDVSVTMDEQSIKDDLMQRYTGVEKVTRLFYEDNDYYEDSPKSFVQVDFTASTDAEKIYREKSIVLGGICRRIRAFKKPAYQRANPKSHENRPQKSKPLAEQDLIDMFEKQKQSLTKVLNSFDEKLEEAINRQQAKTAQRALSNKA